MAWFQTVNYPGGEYACADPAKLLDWLGWDDAPFQTMCGGLTTVPDSPYFIRPCPPDLAEWLAADWHEWQTTTGAKGQKVCRMKIPGGWLYDTPTSAPFPVRGADGITLLEAGDE